MSDKDLLDNLFYRLNEIAKSEGIQHISKFTIEGKHPLTYYTEVTTQHERIKTVPRNLWDDIFFISNDLVFFTLMLFLHRPLINVATKEDGTYFQNWYDARYLSYASILHSAVYNFWDRIGDLLSCFFDTGLPDNRIYVGRVLNNFPVAHRSSSFFGEINSIYRDHVQSFIFERNEDVHNQSLATTHYYGIVLARGDRQQELTDVKLNLPEVFEEQIVLAYRGFELSLRLIQEKVPEA